MSKDNKKDAAAEAEAKASTLRLKSATNFAYLDPDTGIRYGHNAVKVAGPVRQGSWLDCQMKAGLIVED